MTTDRYRHYNHAIELIDGLDPTRAGSESKVLLRDAAEGLLLSRESGAETDELVDEAALTLAWLRSAGVIPRSRAEKIWAELCASGPVQACGEPGTESQEVMTHG